MADNISRMYRMFNIDKVFYVSDDITDNLNLNSIKEDYPPFTEFKQLELIKWIVLNVGNITIYTNPKNEFFLTCIFQGGNSKNFPKALAGLVCELWEELTEVQREEVRGILR